MSLYIQHFWAYPNNLVFGEMGKVVIVTKTSYFISYKGVLSLIFL